MKNKLPLITISLLSTLFCTPNTALAQLVPDRTLGNENSIVTPVDRIRNNIEGGATRGANLFHSFQEFNINSGRKVYFNNPAGVNNIITRVTGGNVSNILGTLGVNGNANLYLINPNGIFFGNGAKLDINGTFTGTTGDGIKLGTNAFYSATDINNSSLLTIEPGASFIDQNRQIQGVIINEGKLTINQGGNINLYAGEINNIGTIEALSGNISLEAITGNIYTGNIDVSSPINNTEATGNGGDINLKGSNDIIVNQGNLVVTSGLQSGNIDIKTDKAFQVINGGRIRSINENIKPGGNINISAEKVEIIGIDSNNSFFSSLVFINSGNRPRLKITTKTLRVIDGGVILGGNPGDGGEGGNIDILAKNIEVIGANPINGRPPSVIAQNSNSGNLKIKTNSLVVRDGGQIGASSSTNRGGNLEINAEKIELVGINPTTNSSSGLFSNTRQGSESSDAGKINIQTQLLIVKNGATINASNFSTDSRVEPSFSRSGNINIKSSRTFLDRGTITTNGNQQSGGNITIDSSVFISLKNQSKISTNVEETIGFTGGNLTINSPFIIALPKDNEFTATAITSRGGNININTKAIFGYPQNLKIDASSQLGIDGNININGLTNDLNQPTFESENISVEQDEIPELKKCPLQYGLNKISLQSESNREIPAIVGACKNERGNVVIF